MELQGTFFIATEFLSLSFEKSLKLVTGPEAIEANTAYQQKSNMI